MVATIRKGSIMANVNEKEVLTAQDEVKTASEERKLIVERETYEGKDGNEYWSYFVRGLVRGREKKVDFVAVDQGGYEVLDIIFGIKDTAELLIREEVMLNNDGTKTNYTVYEVFNADEDGEIYSYQVKPARKSDKALLNFLFIELSKAKKS